MSVGDLHAFMLGFVFMGVLCCFWAYSMFQVVKKGTQDAYEKGLEDGRRINKLPKSYRSIAGVIIYGEKQ